MPVEDCVDRKWRGWLGETLRDGRIDGLSASNLHLLDPNAPALTDLDTVQIYCDDNNRGPGDFSITVISPSNNTPTPNPEIFAIKDFCDDWLWTGTPGDNPHDLISDGRVNFADFAELCESIK